MSFVLRRGREVGSALAKLIAMAMIFVALGAAACGGRTASGAGWSSSPPPECGTVVASWNGLDAYSNGGGGAHCDGAPALAGWHAVSAGRFAFGRAWDACELVNRHYQTRYAGIAPIVGTSGVERCRGASRVPADYAVHGGVFAPTREEPAPGDALVWSAHIAIVTSADTRRLTFMQQNWETASGFAATDTVSWSGPDGFGANGGAGSYGDPVCWIHVLRAAAAGGPSGIASDRVLE
jgi:hypothetical protein